MQQIQVFFFETFWNFFPNIFNLGLIESLDSGLADMRANCMPLVGYIQTTRQTLKTVFRNHVIGYYVEIVILRLL